MHNQIQVWSLKKYTPELLVKELKNINFPNYNIFSSVNIAYLDLMEKISSNQQNCIMMTTYIKKLNIMH